jgi:transcriptional regulator with XRE-family HTH domain
VVAVTLGEELQRLRVGAGLSLKELANKTGIFFDHLANIEAGRAVPSPEALRSIAEHLSGAEEAFERFRLTAPAEFAIDVIDARESAQLLMLERPNLTKYMGERCVVDATGITIVTLRNGATRYLAYGFGLLGYILNPLLGSLSAVRITLTMPWPDIQQATSGSPQTLHILGKRQEDGKLWTCTVASAASEAILAEIVARQHLAGRKR